MVAYASRQAEAWRSRLDVPNYQIAEAARYAQVNPARVRAWHSGGGADTLTLTPKVPREGLSYLQLIELAVVAAFRKTLPLKTIRAARAFAAQSFKSDHPFAEYRFKTDGRSLLADLDQLEDDPGSDRLVNVNRKGQLEWTAMLETRLQEFEYDHELAVRWHVAGPKSPIVIDPRIAFGSPMIRGTPTWVFRDRLISGEPIAATARDFRLKVSDVEAALKFEGVDLSAPPESWLH